MAKQDKKGRVDSLQERGNEIIISKYLGGVLTFLYTKSKKKKKKLPPKTFPTEKEVAFSQRPREKEKEKEELNGRHFVEFRYIQVACIYANRVWSIFFSSPSHSLANFTLSYTHATAKRDCV